MKKDLYLVYCIAFIMGLPFYAHAQIISTYAGTGVTGYSGDNGPATLATFNTPTSLAANKSGDVYINDQENNCIRLVKNNATKTIATFAGTGMAGYYGNNVPATTAKLNQSWSIATDNAGNLYIADQDNNCIRKVDTSGIITTIGGVADSFGSGGDGGPATLARFSRPFGIAVDKQYNVFVCDQDVHVVRRINSAGIISTIAGRAGISGYSGDGGPATSATIGICWGIAADTSGNVYICDGDNNNVRKVSTSGIISTIAGTGSAGYNGDGRPATSALLNFPTGVLPDLLGNIYISDCYNNRIRKINPSGIITTVAGNGTPGFYGDGGLATSAELNHPTSIALDDSGNMYVNDLENIRVRKIKKINLLFFTGGHIQYQDICENSLATPIDQVLQIIDYYTGLTDSWHPLLAPTHGSLFVTYSTLSTGDSIVPAGLSYTPASGYTGADSFRVGIADGILADTTTIYVTVKPLVPVAGGIYGPAAVCPGASIALSDSIPGGIWSGSNGDATVTQNDSNGIVVGVSAGIDTIIYSVNNNCGTGYATTTITVNPLPDTGVITGPSDLCAGDTILLTDTVPGGMWAGDNIRLLIIQAASGIRVTGTVTGQEIIKYTVSDSFCTAAAAKTITINPLPYAGTIDGPGSVCMGATILLADSVAGGTWGTTNGNATATAAMVPGEASVAGITAGADTILYTVNFFCGTATATKTITISPAPPIPAILENGYFLYVPASYFSYQWYQGGALIPGAVRDTFTETIAGIYTVTVGNIDGCTTTSPAFNSPDCNDGELIIFPNPASSLVNIQWCKDVVVKIVCADGKIYKTTTGLKEIDIGGLPDGNYLFEVFDMQEKKIKTKTITKISK